MSQRLNNLNNIIATLEAGAKFYREASRKISSDELATMFQEHAQLREDSAAQLAAIVDAQGGEPASASAVEQARGLYGKVMSMIGDTDERLVNHLEEHEDRTLEVYRTAIRDRDNDTDEQMLREQLAKFEESHEKMRALKKAA